MICQKLAFGTETKKCAGLNQVKNWRGKCQLETYKKKNRFLLIRKHSQKREKMKIQISWKDRTGEHLIVLKNATPEIALERAKFFGYVEPRWWEFWKKKLTIREYPNSKS